MSLFQYQEDLDMNAEETVKKSIGREILEWGACLIVAVIITLLLRNFVFTIVRVDGTSMDPTLSHGQRLVMIRLGYKPAAGDIVVVDPNKEGTPKAQKKPPYIKRIIGMPGDVIEFEKDAKGSVTLYINGEKTDEAYISSSVYTFAEEKYTVPEGHVFVMGDNRPASLDSRNPSVGFIPFERVLGKASFRIWPLNKIGTP